MRNRFSCSAGTRRFLPCLAGVVWMLAGVVHAQAARQKRGPEKGSGSFFSKTGPVHFQ